MLTSSCINTAVEIKNQTSKTMKSIKCVVETKGATPEGDSKDKKKKKQKKPKKGEAERGYPPLITTRPLQIKPHPKRISLSKICRASPPVPRMSSSAVPGSLSTSTPTSRVPTATGSPRRSKSPAALSSTSWYAAGPSSVFYLFLIWIII